MIYILYIILLFFIIYGVLNYKKIFNPISIFNGIWFLTILLYNFKLSYLQEDLYLDTIVLFIIMAISFNISYIYTALIFTFTKKSKNLNTNNNEYKIDIKRRNLIIMFRIWIAVTIIEIIYSKGLPIIWIIIGSSKTYFDFGIPTIHGLANAFSLIIILLSYSYLNINDKNDKRIRNNIITIFIMYFCFITRQVIISALLEIIILKILFISKKNKRIPIYTLIIASIFMIIGFGIIGNIRTGYDGFYNVALMKKKIPWIFIGFHWVYMYLTMTVANINHMCILNLGNTCDGVVASTFLPTVISNMIFKQETINLNDYLVTPAFNVAGFFREFYADSGLLGLIIICFIYGALGGWIYSKYLHYKNYKNAIYYAIYIQVIALSFFYNQLLYLPSGFQFFIILLYTKLQKKERCAYEHK